MASRIEIRIEVMEGKYAFIKFEDDYRIHVHRYGEPWIEIESGSNAILALMNELDEVIQ